MPRKWRRGEGGENLGKEERGAGLYKLYRPRRKRGATPLSGAHTYNRLLGPHGGGR